MMHPRARAQRLEMVIGIIGFFDLIALINAVVALARGRSVAPAVIILVGFSALLFFAVRVRQRMTL